MIMVLHDSTTDGFPYRYRAEGSVGHAGGMLRVFQINKKGRRSNAIVTYKTSSRRKGFARLLGNLSYCLPAWETEGATKSVSV